MLYRLASPAASQQLQRYVLENPAIIGSRRAVWVLASDDVDMLLKGKIDRHEGKSSIGQITRQIKQDQDTGEKQKPAPVKRPSVKILEPVGVMACLVAVQVFTALV